MFSQASIILSTISLMATRSLLILVTVRSESILLECFLVSHFCVLLSLLKEKDIRDDDFRYIVVENINSGGTETKEFLSTIQDLIDQEVKKCKPITSILF